MSNQFPRILEGALLPPRLGDLASPPARLYLRGELPRGPAVAIVGTRRASPEARWFAGRLALGLSRRGIAVFSGGAEGIDTRAHRGALRGSAPTVVVAPAGYAKPYPPENQLLFRHILKRGGAYLSLCADDEPAQLGAFFARNACLVALVHAVVVVEARWRSGARNAAKWARRLGRPLLAVPASPWHKPGSGCNLELKLGAKPCTGVKDVLEALERALVLPPRAPGQKKPRSPPIGQRELVFPDETEDQGARAVLGAIRRGATHLDAICEASGLPPAVVQSHVLTLTLEGVLVADPALGLGARLVSVSKFRK